jgi:hypothetical protein
VANFVRLMIFTNKYKEPESGEYLKSDFERNLQKGI